MKKTSLSMAILFAIHGQVAQADGRVMAEILVEGSAPVSSSKALAGGPLDAEELSGLGATADGGELLKNINGISVRHKGGHGFDPYIRGQHQQRLNILLDGAFLHGGCPNRMDPPSSYAALETYDKVTILKGGQSVIYGAGAPGATILFDRETQPLAAGEKQGKAGVSFKDNGNFKKVYADGTFGMEQGFLRLGGVVADANDYEDGDGTSVRSGFKNRHATVTAGFETAQDGMVEVGLEHNREEDVLFAGSGMDTPETVNDAIRVKYQGAVDVELYSTQVDHDMDNYTLRTKSGTTMPMRHITNSDTVGGKLSRLIQVGETEWSVGVDFKNQNRDSMLYANAAAASTATTLSSYGWPDAHIDQRSLFAEAERSLDEKDSLAYGLRYDYVDPHADKAATSVTDYSGSSKSADSAYTDAYGLTAANADEEHNVGGFVNWSRKQKDGSNVYVALSRSVRTADATERFNANRKMMAKWNMIGNPGLDPEKHHQIELGAEGKVSGWGWNGSVYYNDVSDYILKYQATVNANTTDLYKNVDATFWGYEVGGNRALTDNLSLTANLAFVHATNDTESRAIGQIAPLNGVVSLDYAMAEWDLGTRLRFADNQDRVDTDNGIDVGETGGYGVVDLYGTRPLQGDAELKFGIDNLFDRTYADHLNPSDTFGNTAQVNEPGRTVWLKANYRF